MPEQRETAAAEERAAADVSRIHEARDLDEAIAYRLHRTNRLLLTHLGRVLSEHHPTLTSEMWFVLARVDRGGPVRPVELTEPALVDAPNVSRLVEKLVRAGLVERSPDPDDRRSHLLRSTPEGGRLAAQVRRRTVDERHRVFDGFDARELIALTAALDRIDDNVRPLLARDDADRH